MNEWISVEDRLPEVGKECLWWSPDHLVHRHKHGSVELDMLERRSLSDGGHLGCVYNYLHNYTHWMELPDAPGNAQQQVPADSALDVVQMVCY